MITYDKALVCLDLTEEDQAILQSTCELAKIFQTKEVTFINVIRDFNLPDSLKAEFPNLLEQAVEERKSQLSETINKNFDCEHIQTKILIRQGNETKEILTASVEEQSDLIVLGRKKNSDSVLSTRITRRAACNLLLVPVDTKIKFDRVLVPVDFSNYSELSLKTALALCNKNGSEITLQNVYNVPSGYRYSGKSFGEFAEIMEENSKKDLSVLLKQVNTGNQKISATHSHDNGQGIIKLVYNEAVDSKVDLIVMGAKGRTATSALFIGSKAERMIQMNDSIPLLVVREKGANAGILESLQDL